MSKTSFHGRPFTPSAWTAACEHHCFTIRTATCSALWPGRNPDTEKTFPFSCSCCPILPPGAHVLGKGARPKWYQGESVHLFIPQPHPDLPSQSFLTIAAPTLSQLQRSALPDLKGGQNPHVLKISISMAKGNQGFPFQTKVFPLKENSIIRFKAFKDELHNLNITGKSSIYCF